MITVCLVGVDVVKEKTLLGSQSGIVLHQISNAALDEMLGDIARHDPDILVISDVGGQIDADTLCLHTYMQNPAIKTLIVTSQDADYQRLERTGFSCKGFMLHQQCHAIVRAVRVMYDGEAWLSRTLVTAVIDHLASIALAGYRKAHLVRNQ